MTTPERIAGIRADLDEGFGSSVNRTRELLDHIEALTRDRDDKGRACQTLGSIIQKYGEWVVEVTDSQDLLDEDGDGDWEVVWDRLFELRAERDRLRAELDAGK